MEPTLPGFIRIGHFSPQDALSQAALKTGCGSLTHIECDKSCTNFVREGELNPHALSGTHQTLWGMRSVCDILTLNRVYRAVSTVGSLPISEGIPSGSGPL